VAKPGKAVSRDTALRKFGEGKRAAAGTEGFGTPRQPFWSAVASGIPRDTALRKFGEGKRAAAGTEGFGTPRQPFWSAVASGIPRDTALRSKKTEPN